jgi:hypothetical protein
VLAYYSRFRFLWGAVDWQGGSESPYTNAQTGASLGTSAAAGVGVGVRRAVLCWDRSGMLAGMDDAQSHFDFLNITGGDPDDTWTSGDYTTLETAITTWWAAIRGDFDNAMSLRDIKWYRHGPGIHPPNPAERVTSPLMAGTSAATALPPQVATTLTFRTAVRRSWGRTYIPGLTTSHLTSEGGLANAKVDALATATNTLVHTANDADFPLVVTSVHLNAVLNCEATEVDDVLDIQRKRRYKHYQYRVIHNT